MSPPSFYVGMSIDFVLFHICLYSHNFEIYGYHFCVIFRTQILTTDFLILWFFLSHLLRCFLTLRYRGCVIAGYLIINCSMRFNQLWFSVMISVTVNYFFNERQELHLSVDIRTCSKIVVRNYTGLAK